MLPRNSFPKRGEVYNQFTSTLRATHMFKLYFTNERSGMADQRLSGFLTECEAYLHGPNSGAWLNDGVSSGYSSKPEFTGMDRMNIDIQEGHPYNLAMWQVASVLYLKRIKDAYSATWQKMLQGEDKYGDVGRLFLAHFDRFDFLLRLYIDKNNVGASHRDGGSFKKEEIREARTLTAKNVGVIKELRSALAPGSGSGSGTGSGSGSGSSVSPPPVVSPSTDAAGPLSITKTILLFALMWFMS